MSFSAICPIERPCECSERILSLSGTGSPHLGIDGTKRSTQHHHNRHPDEEAPDLVRMNALAAEEQRRFLKARASTTDESVSFWLRTAINAEMAKDASAR